MPIFRQTSEEFGHCGRAMFADIRCRTVGTHQSPESAGFACQLDEGVKCVAGSNSECADYEISLLCDCSRPPSTDTPITFPEPVTPVDPSPLPDLPEQCDEGWTDWMNHNKPDYFGEFETLESLRSVYSFCADHQIQEVECRQASTGDDLRLTKCDLTGSTCRNNGQLACMQRYINQFTFLMVLDRKILMEIRNSFCQL